MNQSFLPCVWVSFNDSSLGVNSTGGIHSAQTSFFFALCLQAPIFSFLIGVSAISHFISSGTLGWVLSELCDLLYLNYSSCSLGFTVVICPSLRYLHIVCQGHCSPKSIPVFFFFFPSVTLSAICPSNNAPACNFSGGILHEEFCTLPLLLHKICQDGWGFHAALNRLSKNSFISTNVFTSAQSTKQFAKTNNLYIYSSFPTDKLFR